MAGQLPHSRQQFHGMRPSMRTQCSLSCKYQSVLWHLKVSTRYPIGVSASPPEKARAVVLRTYSSTLSMSGRMAAIMVARPAALARLAMISLQGQPGQGRRLATGESQVRQQRVAFEGQQREALQAGRPGAWAR